jgi:hypothetical protein
MPDPHSLRNAFLMIDDKLDNLLQGLIDTADGVLYVLPADLRGKTGGL